MDNIYFDNAATTAVSDNVLNVINNMMTNCYANPSAKHRFGFLAEKEIQEASAIIAKILNCEPKEIIWTSGGTESNNFAIRSIVDSLKRKGNHIITSKIEHPSVKNVYKYLESLGYQVDYIGVDKNGKFNILDIKNSLKDDTIFVSLMHINNEIGTVEDIENISKIIKGYNKNIILHIDAVQSFTKLEIHPKTMGIDSLSVSGHKFHGPKGIGFLYIDKSIKINPLIFGGGQQNNMRSGTLNTPGICGLAEAAKNIYDDFNKYTSYLYSLRDYLIDSLDKLNNDINGIHLITKKTIDFSPHIVSFAVENVRAEVMLHALEDKKIYVSSGSACSSKNKNISDTLLAIDLDKNLLDNTIRVSFSKYNTIREIDIFINELKQIIPTFRRFNK